MGIAVTLGRLHSRRLGELYAEHARDAGRLAYLLVGDRDLAEDLVQDAFVRVAAKFWKLRDPSAFDAYLRRTVVNLARGHMRKMGRERVARAGLESRRTEVEASDPTVRDELFRSLDVLSPKQRSAIVLRFYLDLSEQQTADLLDLPVGTVKSLVSRAREILRKHLEAVRDG